MIFFTTLPPYMGNLGASTPAYSGETWRFEIYRALPKLGHFCESIDSAKKLWYIDDS